MIQMTMKVKPVKLMRVAAANTANDNEETLWSRLSWSEQKIIQKRIDDLQWQLSYATIQLKAWRNLDNGAWTSLENMREKAQSELDGMMFG